VSVRSWWRGCKRRKPGIYLARTRKHRNPNRRENGYVGKSRHLALRQTCHEGTCRHRCKPKPWLDLDPVWRALRLPWWLGWPWILGPLEVLAIRLLLTRYNDTHNHHNPRRVPISLQHRQRAQRDAGPVVVRASHIRVRATYTAYRVAGAALILVGFTGWALHH
jgi:hypothetical protein